MAHVVFVNCPNCANRIQIDPDLEVASCSACNRSSFVQTPRRRAPADVRVSVIDVAPRRTASVGISWLVAAGSIALATFAVLQVRSRPVASNDETPGAHATAAVESLQAPASQPAPELKPAPSVAPPAQPGLSDDGAQAPAPKRGMGKRQMTATVRAGGFTVSGHLSPDLIEKVVRQNFGRIRMCHEQGLARSGARQGRVTVRFVIGRDGSVSNVSRGDSTLADAETIHCVLTSFSGLQFPAPEGGIVTVVVPLLLSAEA
jgi:hypothetical protein